MILKKINRITAITAFVFITLSCEHGISGNKQSAFDNSKKSASKKETLLPIPPLLKGRRNKKGDILFSLTVQKGESEFFNNMKNSTYGYNGPLLGPTIRARRGQLVRIKVKNTLREYTTVHWHGMLVPGIMDGGPHQVIQPDGEWNVYFRINQPAATTWYHPHGIGTTAVQVYMGLAGLFILDDEVSDRLNIPKDYGKNDIPLIVQDKSFTSYGVLIYLRSMRDVMEGMKGDTILVNGVVSPVLNVTASKYRFRLLNGSNAKIYNFRLSNDRPFYQIASDAGFLEKPVKMNNLRLSPGERAEIIIDFSGYKEKDYLYLASDNYFMLKFKVGQKIKDTTEIPAKLTNIMRIPKEMSSRSRIFNLSGMGHNVNINGRKMDMNYINEYVKYKNVETWVISSNTGGMMGMMRTSGVFHNFHAHGIHFQVIERSKSAVPENEKGWKDTIFLDRGETVKVITRFLYKGIFMYHCHILEHEDNGMMGQFKVE